MGKKTEDRPRVAMLTWQADILALAVAAGPSPGRAKVRSSICSTMASARSRAARRALTRSRWSGRAAQPTRRSGLSNTVTFQPVAVVETTHQLGG